MSDQDTTTAHPVAENLRRLREAAGLSQAELADAAGSARPNIGEYERAQRDPSAYKVQRLANALGVCPGLLYGTNCTNTTQDPLRISPAQLAFQLVDVPMVTIEAAARPGRIKLEDIYNVWPIRRDFAEGIAGLMRSYDDVLDRMAAVGLHEELDPDVRHVALERGAVAWLDRRPITRFIDGAMYLVSGPMRTMIRRIQKVGPSVYVSQVSTAFEDTRPEAVDLGDRPLSDMFRGRVVSVLTYELDTPATVRRWRYEDDYTP